MAGAWLSFEHIRLIKWEKLDLCYDIMYEIPVCLLVQEEQDANRT